MIKKILLGSLLAVVLYFAGGIGLLAAGVIDRLYFWPGWSVKGPKSKKKVDQSGFAADGPLVFYQNKRLISKRIAPRGSQLVIETDTLQANDTAVLRCFVDSMGREFRVPLRPAAVVPADAYPAPEKLLAISDIEGNFKAFEMLLQGAGVVDEKLAWQFGRGHLVLVGDFFDRGLNVTECLWLIYKLEQEAKQAGGQVHFILGNHERMNMMGHFKYVRRKYEVNADMLGVAYDQWYSRSTVLGQWLRTKNVVEKIGPVLFVHGGISPEVAERRLSLRQLNVLARTSIDMAAANQPPLDKHVTQAPSSPDWYRGLVLEEPSEAQIKQILSTYAATQIVVGHTPVESIKRLYGGKIIAIDLPHQERTDRHETLQALWMEDGTFTIIDSHGQKSGF
ncbi:metallophosphoesterase [Hymenobacter algoricola]|uniref:Calcineurin-like phosphoesterase domain-containing protein n=1 Tax=Hymenobacter algoricola TaxID=486267 RepID=A0ABP7MSI7_9BACT